MAHFHIKKKKGRPYLYVREIARVGGKPKVVSQIYVGSPERVAAMGDTDDFEAEPGTVYETADGTVGEVRTVSEGVSDAAKNRRPSSRQWMQKGPTIPVTMRPMQLSQDNLREQNRSPFRKR